MTTASKILKTLLGEDYSYYPAVPAPVGTQSPDDNSDLVPNPNDAKAYSAQNRSMQLPDQQSLADRIGNIIDSLDQDDITDELADIVENYLEQVDPNGDMTVEDAAMMLPVNDCQALYQQLVVYLKSNDIDYSEDPSDDDMELPDEIPLDLYPSSSGMIMGGNPVAPSGSFNIGN